MWSILSNFVGQYSMLSMSQFGPIIVIEDDEDDQFLILHCLLELEEKNICHCFSNGQQAYEYLLKTDEQPFLILCDVNMPVMNGLELRERIESDPKLKDKAIPFIFLSTSDSEGLVRKAYNGTIQGFYKKAESFDELKESIRLIIAYWRRCLHPNNLIGNPTAKQQNKH